MTKLKTAMQEVVRIIQEALDSEDQDQDDIEVPEVVVKPAVRKKKYKGHYAMNPKPQSRWRATADLEPVYQACLYVSRTHAKFTVLMVRKVLNAIPGNDYPHRKVRITMDNLTYGNNKTYAALIRVEPDVVKRAA